ncbi:pentatricopeptide repeat-containing protein, putative [Ricinus communis]|uniref:Pentatricopeptide repeat-containing protein, putative n=1 Tax=Ricinus communis TaxID=3988 RepID=B9S6P5_RICCO|nr:pentatricopeptide repeat-containing protein, putative [Ricinus communis]
MNDMKRFIEHVRTAANHYASLLQLCCPQSPISYPFARTIHAHMIASGFKPHGHTLNRLIYIYCKSSKLSYARSLFDEIPQPDIVARTTLINAYSATGHLKLAKEMFYETPLIMRDAVIYNAMITAYSHNNDGHAAIELFCDMKRNDFRPDNFTFTSVLGALALVAENERHCQQLHCTVVKSGTWFVTSVLNALISVYVKCASSPSVISSSLMGAARRLFDEMPVRDELSWTTIITGYVKNDDLDAAREVFDGMREKLVVVWNAMISGYMHRGLYQEALEMFRKMYLAGLKLDEFTYTSIISACANAGFLQHGKQVHAYILKTEAMPSPDFSLPVNNALVTLYWKCGKVDEAQEVFNNMPVRDLVSWNTILSGYLNAGRMDEAKTFFEEMPEKNILSWVVMISGLAQNGFGEEGLKLFNQMKLRGFEPCDYAFAGAITSCSMLGLLEHGRQLHAQLVRFGFDSSLSAGNALITMYARCGVVEAARTLFLSMPCVDSVSWNAMIAALGQHGYGVQAIELFEEMLIEGILPDRITFLTVLSACSHAGLVKEGHRYFNSMSRVYRITPELGDSQRQRA